MAKVHAINGTVKNVVEFNLDLNAIHLMPFQITGTFCGVTKSKIMKRIERENLNKAFEGIERPAPFGLERDPDADELGKYLWVVFNMTDCMVHPFSGEPMDFLSYLRYPVRAKEAEISEAVRRGKDSRKLVKEYGDFYDDAMAQVTFAESFELVEAYPEDFYSKLDSCIETRSIQIMERDGAKTAENDADLALLAGLRSQI